ncbi:YihY family inner membrane protein, partial [bacterium]|nr:YihY family inner membrane protein [bacterium]
MKIKGILKEIFNFADRARKFITIDIWNIDTFLYKQIRKAYLIVKGFMDDKCLLRSSALTYTTLLSVVPLFAAILLVIKGFGSGGEDKLIILRLQSLVEKLIPTAVAYSGGETLSHLFASRFHEFASKMSASKVGGVGVVFLVLTAVSLLKTIEKSMNDIWGIRQHRSFVQRLVIYWAMITLTPILILPALSTKFISQSQAFVDFLAALIPFSWFSGIIQSQMLPITFMAVAFTLLYMIMPNTKVKFKSALAGGVTASLLFNLAINLFGFVMSLTGKAQSFQMVYGALALIPLMLIFIYFVWIIILLGAEVSFADQNASTYHIEQKVAGVNQVFKEKLSLRIMYEIAKHFKAGTPIPDAKRLYDKLGVP